MKEITMLLEQFERRNNLSTASLVYSDGSSSLSEFQDYDLIVEAKTIEEMENFLKNTQLQLDEDGKCLKPFVISLFGSFSRQMKRGLFWPYCSFYLELLLHCMQRKLVHTIQNTCLLEFFCEHCKFPDKCILFLHSFLMSGAVCFN